MKTPTILILVLGLASVIADSILIEETSNNKKPCPKIPVNSESATENTVSEFNTPEKDTIIIEEIDTVPNPIDDKATNTEAASELVNDFLTNSNMVIETDPAQTQDNTPTNNIVILENADPPSDSANDTPAKNTLVIEKIDIQPNLVNDAPNVSDGVLDIVIDDNAAPTSEDINIGTPLQDVNSADPFENIFKSQSTINEEFSVPSYLYRNGIQSGIASEIMAAAKGFAPLPLFSFRRKQNSRRRFAIRRRYNGYPYRRRFNPYYSFYRPSSLSYYY